MKRSCLGYLLLTLAVLLCIPSSGFSTEVDATRHVTWVVDGDTFDTSSGDTVRLADIDTPESGEPGYHEATDLLISLIKNRTVYLDIDDMNRTDSYGRLVCVVYVDFNETHYMNVNEVLLIHNLATVWDHPNEFDPREWTLFALRTKEKGVADSLTVVVPVASVAIASFAIFLFRRRRSR